MRRRQRLPLPTTPTAAVAPRSAAAHPFDGPSGACLGAVAIVVAYFGFHWFTYRLSHSITDDAFVEAHIVNVAPEMVSGRIVRFLVEENDRVEQGQVLAEIEPVHYRDQVEQARGKLELAEAELKRQEAGLAKLKKEVPLQIDIADRHLPGRPRRRANDALKLTADEVTRPSTRQGGRRGRQGESVLAKQEYDRCTNWPTRTRRRCAKPRR